MNKGTLLGFADIEVDKWGVSIYGVSLHEKNGAKWIGIPSREVMNDGEKKYYPFFKFKEKNHFEIFTKAVFEAVNKKINEDQTR